MSSPMSGSVAAQARAKLSPELRAVCEAIDKSIADMAAKPSHDSQRVNDWREGFRDGLIALRSTLERGA